ncbi:hypothetical protein [Kribbella sp. NPDC004536]|uniref:hypothetical protein n=1 Tax=Kribbella sp. NPDC004536 TaxID=3364106 RepID=UPI0036C9E9F1
MKRFVTGVAALAGAGALLLGGALPSHAATQSVAASNSATVTYKLRYFNHSSEGYHASAVLPATWKAVQLSIWHARFDDSAHNRMIRINTAYNPNLGTITALNQKIKSLKNTRGLHIVGTSTVTMKSTTGQGPLRASTVVYTYRSGSTTRWVATRYVGWSGRNAADVEFSTAGSPKDSKLLGTTLNKATVSLTLAG